MEASPPDPLRDAARELYGLAPEEFVAARDALATRARRSGDRELAGRLKALRRPSSAAWAVNRLARDQPEEIDRLLALGRRLRAAQEDPASEDLRELNRERHALLATVVSAAGASAAAAGRPLAEPVRRQVQATLGAAMADPVAGAAVRSALMVGDLESTGFGPVIVDDAVALPPEVGAVEHERPAAAPAVPSAPAEATPAPAPEDPGDALARQEAEAALARARDRLAQAARDHEQARARLEHLHERRTALGELVRDLTAQVRDLARQAQDAREEDDRAALEERTARHDLDAAARAERDAERAAARAQALLDRLAGAPPDDAPPDEH